MPLSHLGTDTSPRSDFSGLQRMVMTELRPWSHDAVTCRDLRGKKELFFFCTGNSNLLAFLLYL